MTFTVEIPALPSLREVLPMHSLPALCCILPVYLVPSLTYLNTTYLLVAAATILLFYQAIKPRPLPGIPFIAESAQCWLGDLPAALAHRKQSGTITDYPRHAIEKLQHPVLQIFLRPFSRPWVVVSDAQEAQDILSLRAREFERSGVFSDCFRALVPHSMVSMRTHGQRWKFNRNLVRDTMNPKFLSAVISPSCFEATMDMLGLWKEKARLADGRPVYVAADISMAVTDLIWKSTFGSSLDSCKLQREFLSALPSIDMVDVSSTKPAGIPECARPAPYEALATLYASMYIPVQTLMGSFAHGIAIQLVPSLRRSMAFLDGTFRSKLQEARRKVARGSAGGSRSSAIDLIAHREYAALTKSTKVSDRPTHSEVRDELLAFFLAGSTTTTETVHQGIRLLSEHPLIQVKLRTSVREALGLRSDQLPTTEAIAEARIDYLEAFMYEVLRLEVIVSNHIRVATIDTEILGCPIPKGTEVLLNLMGPGLKSKPLPVDEERRSPTSRATDKEYPHKWKSAALETFDPERWLAADGKFDCNRAPMLTFGEGPRACFGRRAALVEMRLIYSLVVWHFELLPPPVETCTGGGKHSGKDLLVRLRELPT